MNPSPTFWRDCGWVVLAIAVLLVIAGLVEHTANAIL